MFENNEIYEILVNVLIQHIGIKIIAPAKINKFL
jgi:hypothetical protein